MTIDDREILFVTTSMGTRWDSYSRALVRAGFPTSQHRIVDGRSGWHPLMFTENLDWESCEVAVLVDEDCFVDEGGLRSVIAEVMRDDAFAVAGVPDGGFFYREQNPYACNLFLLVLKARRIASALAKHPDWRSYRYDPSWQADPLPDWIDRTRVSLVDYEPYYGFFWALRKEGLGTLRLRPESRTDNFATEVYFGSERVGTHMWYLRNWGDVRIMPGHSMPNRTRYELMGRALRDRFGWRQWIAYLSFEAKRYGRRSIERALSRNVPLQ